jgi:DNA-directed RNA polymerase specialized sigma subunit
LAIARPERQAPKAKERLMAFAETFARREAELEQAADQLRAERDKAIRAAYKDGLPMKAIAQVMGMSHQRVSQIVRS